MVIRLIIVCMARMVVKESWSSMDTASKKTQQKMVGSIGDVLVIGKLGLFWSVFHFPFCDILIDCPITVFFSDAVRALDHKYMMTGLSIWKFCRQTTVTKFQNKSVFTNERIDFVQQYSTSFYNSLFQLKR